MEWYMGMLSPMLLVQLGKNERRISAAEAKAIGHGHFEILLLCLVRHKVELHSNIRLG